MLFRSSGPCEFSVCIRTVTDSVANKSRQYRNFCRSTRRASATNKYQGCCSQIKGKSKTHNRENLLVQQQPYRCMKEDGFTLSHQNKILLRTISRRKLSVFFDTIKHYSENKMTQLNSTELNSIFEIILHKYSIGLMIVGKLVWQQEEVRKEDISIALL